MIKYNKNNLEPTLFLCKLEEIKITNSLSSYALEVKNILNLKKKY
jgi:hypothetical protein